MLVLNKLKPIIGMVHVGALPGTPNNTLSVPEIINTAIAEAKIYAEHGIDAIMIENMHDIPYLKQKVGPEISSLMAIIAYEIKQKTKLPVGIQILAGANKAALAVAHSAQIDFIRAEGFVFGHLADEGYIESCAGELLRYKKTIGATHIAIFTDIKKKHSSHALTADVDIVETAQAASFFQSNGLVITGEATGKQANIDEVERVKQNATIPVIIGSGITLENIEDYYPLADAFIVGSYFKQQGKWNNQVDGAVVKAFMQKIKSLKEH